MASAPDFPPYAARCGSRSAACPRSTARAAPRCTPSTASTSRCEPASCCASSGRRGAARAPSSTSSPGSTRPPPGTVDRRGRVALMFQEAALFPWLTVRGQHRAGPQAAQACQAASGATRPSSSCTRSTSTASAAKMPHELSGGMRQRVAIARAFAQEADILLMDEPFGALDAMTRDLLHAELERLWADRNLTVVFVTHNVREAARLADRVVLLSSRPGRVVSPFDVDIERPRRMDSPEVSAPGRGDHRAAPDGGAAPCPRLTRDAVRASATPASTRSWPASTPSSSPGGPDARSPPGIWSAAWPKLAAIAHRASVCWQAVVWSRVEARVRPPRPGEGLGRPVGRGRRGDALGGASARPLAAGRHRLRPGAAHRRRWSAPSCRRVRILRAGRRLVHHRPADHAVDRVVPAGDPAVRASERAPCTSSSCWAPRRRSPTASSPASTTSLRCSRAGRTMGAKGVALFRHVILPGCAPLVRRRDQAGLGLRLAQPDGRRAPRDHRQQAVDRRAARAHAASWPTPPPLIAYMLVILVIGIVLDALVFGAAERPGAAPLGADRRAGSPDPSPTAEGYGRAR